MRPIHHNQGHFRGNSEDRFGGERRFARGPFGRHGGPDGGERHFRGGRFGRMLEHGDLRMLVLHLINEKPRHGYEIIKAIEDLAGGGYAPSPGVIYPTLTLLEEIGQVSSTTEGARKSFTTTEAGIEALNANQDAVKSILARIAASQPREAGLPVLRAMENLRTSLRLKLGFGPMSAETTRKIAETLDAAAKAIEES
jgi:DNA-binding PadR family transcriptional regulator